MKVLIPPSLFGFSVFKRKYLKKAGETPDTPEQPKKPETPQEKPPSKVVSANYRDPESLQAEFDPAQGYVPQQYDVPQLTEEQIQAARGAYGVGIGPGIVATPGQQTPTDEPSVPEESSYEDAYIPPGYLSSEEQRTQQFQSVIRASSEQMKFIPEIKRNLDDPTPRLIWADWLEENGQEDYANAIRMQQYLVSEKERFTNDQRNQMLTRQSELFQQHPEWFGVWGWQGRERRRGESPGLASFDRGMLQVESSPRLSFWTNLFGANITSQNEAQLQANAQNSLRNVESMKLDISDEANLNFLVEYSDWIENISSFSLTTIADENEAGLPVQDLQRLLPHFRNLTELSLPGNYLGQEFNDGIGLLANSEQLTNLRKLDLSDNQLSVEDVYRITHSQNLQHLQELDITGHEIGDDRIVFEALLPSPYLRDIRRLALNEDNLTPDAIRALQQRFPGDVLELRHQEQDEPEWIEPMPNLPNEIEPPDLENI